MRFTVAILACVLFPSWSLAQVTLPRNDATVSIGWAGSEYRLSDYDRWRGSLFVGVTGGHYWTEHLKTEVEAGWNNRANSDSYEELIIGELRTSARSKYRIRDVRLAIAQSYQFGHNDWIHPYLGAGADIIQRKIVFDRAAQTGFAYNTPPTRPPTNVVIPAHREDDTSMLVRPFVKTGVKMYASERAFFVTELKLGFAPDLDHALWKLGVGFDF